MSFESLIQYIGAAIFFTILILLLIKRKDIKKFIPVGLFAILYADIWCYIAEYLKIWSYPTRLFAQYTIVSIPFNYFALPVIVMVWIMFCPSSLKGKAIWALSWSLFFISAEFGLTRYTKILAYTNGFDIHISFFLWLISWFIFYEFHVWINSK
ncbi:hypothetical protein Dtox_0607 [Desulfofarcimen acetoxidans DSM 771]|jgi:hypothetical protein|uniref:Uncharacterized protein n=1 Tax=Desulfofarcimen acetoxidans (strain ATCC 49208 / DSM 771 / KCTC 5769 / VKM B-1644 / 5575) TaxID=485916 RepID=C8W672_DESAS|nr:CBO0543 family protein [Desulfofarcimen acetoxidans]ACV61527.1 hypothetical protein Dtox_0607 [Desulfofarcimen acetoxidans DSM 771]